MAVPSTGYTNRLGVQSRYQYRKTIYSRDSTHISFSLEVRFMPSADVAGSVMHGTVAYAVDPSHPQSSQTRRITDKGFPAGSWTNWFTVFDGDVAMGMDERMLYVFPDMWVVPGAYDQSAGALDDGIDVGEYPRPASVARVTVAPSRIDVSEQDEATITARWSSVANADMYRVYVNDGRHLNGAKVASETAATSLTFNPKQVMGGASWRSREVRDGYVVYVGVLSLDSYGVPSDSVKWSDGVSYGEARALAPSQAYVVGLNGERNELMCCGEPKAELHYTGGSDGSYEVTDFSLVRQDGASVSWRKQDADDDGDWNVVRLDFAQWGEPNSYAQFELRAYDENARPVYMGNGSWLKFSVRFYGGLLGVYGKERFDGDELSYMNLAGDEAMRTGLCWVYDGSTWLRARAVHVMTPSGWKTM